MDFLSSLSFLKYGKTGIEIDGISYERIVQKYDTPVFLFSKKRFEENISTLKAAFKQFFPSFKLAFAFKANTVLPILKIAAQNGLLAEVMSDFELQLAQLAEFKSSNVIFNGPAKSRKELILALEENVGFINCDSFSEVKELEKLCSERHSKIHISLRVHPPLDPQVEKETLVKRGSKLGLDLDRARRIYRYIHKSKHLVPYGIHAHLGTQRTTPLLHVSLAKALARFVKELESEGINLEGINLGGGFASRYVIETNNGSLETFASQIKDVLTDIADDCTLFLEPGRLLIGDAIVGLTRVLRKKKSWGKVWNLLDIGANILIPLRFSQYTLLPVTPQMTVPPEAVGGPLCLPVDVLKESINFKTQEQDVLLILNVGAYTFSLSEQFGYLRPPLCMVKNGNISTLVRREKLSDFLQLIEG